MANSSADAAQTTDDVDAQIAAAMSAGLGSEPRASQAAANDVYMVELEQMIAPVGTLAPGQRLLPPDGGIAFAGEPRLDERSLPLAVPTDGL